MDIEIRGLENIVAGGTSLAELMESEFDAHLADVRRAIRQQISPWTGEPYKPIKVTRRERIGWKVRDARTRVATLIAPWLEPDDRW